MNSEEIVFVRRTSGLVREIGAFSVMAMAANYVIADGFYLFTAQQGYYAPGANIPLALLIGGLIMSLAAFAVIFLTMAMPRTASDYIGVSRVLHPLLGYIEAILVFGVHIWIVGALSFFMAWFWGSAIIQVGLATHNSGLVALGEWLSTDTGAAIGLGIFFVLIFGFISLLGTKIYKYVVNILFAVALFAGVITIAGAAYAASLTPAQIRNLWDMTYGTGAYDEIMSIAEAAGWKEYIASATGDPSRWGWPGPWSLEITLSISIVISAYAFWGLEYANYMAGEIDRPKRNFFIGTVGAIVLVFAYYLLISSLTLIGFKEFYSAYQYVMMEASDQVKINPVQTPTWAVFLASLFGGWAPILAVIITIAVPLWVMNGIPVYMMVPSRIAFALSFDRFFPEKLAEVNIRFRTPHWSIALVVIGAILMIFVLASPEFGPLFYAITAVTAVAVRWFLSAVATTLLPYRRPEIYKEGYTKTIGKVPVVSIVGGAAVIATFILLILGLQKVVEDVTLVSPAWMIGWTLLAILLYLYYNWANKKKGIKTEKIFAEVPPA
ncbi:MAG: APC family permease [Aigarchaeota archaeon]|nr:APC family permease [Aigarchaeota archaeon]